MYYIEYVTTKPPKPKNWRCVGGGDGAHRKDFLNFVSKEDKVKSYVKYGFCKKSLRKNALVLYRYLFVKKKVFNFSEFSLVCCIWLHNLKFMIFVSASMCHKFNLL